MIEREQHGNVLVLRMAHGKASALDLEFTAALTAELRAAAQRDHAIVLTGTGNIFTAGVDLFKLTDGGAAYIEKFLPGLRELLLGMFRSPVPVVAAVNGHAIAGGCIMAAACDYRLMVPTGKIGAPELLVGVPFPPLAMEILRSAAAPQFLQRLVLTGATVPATEAIGYGLIDEVVEPPDLMGRAIEVAKRLDAIPREAFQLAREQLRNAFVDRAEQLDQDNGKRILAQWRAPETHDLIRAYLDRTISKKH
jgi:enoyl-CoA hydratase